MKLRDLFDSSGKEFVAKISINMDDVEPEDRNEIAGMLRGLMCAVDGWGRISGLTNDLFEDDGSVIVTFSSVEKAQYFRECVHRYFDETILEALRVRRLVRKANR
ncbi:MULTISPECIES: hypothetical protein [Paraburkholderia]|uniref:Uncharacterized protein n=1 Tax=Paraburkholderia madseniana TaxID=2599607 RepID=A0AAP5BPV7_9BURK|nr:MULTISPECIES: hypothetical protein [Paraburkholderia]MCX4151983.1 hypothetical protein [Paraburkholderia madseniana]MCX4175598.1 hypothetical protein [Paraburkholderia madseniana]MDN7154911.1 hypothetical protein [Paraburkholderia sp. WS6]MDQ6413794.1 hypothetical protein [Paraburkholderia madseniana]MDQ6463594.1 hypothetical protein [Paraburkholderia madseniana]